MPLEPDDERRHVPESVPGWQETWWMQFSTADGEIAGVITITLIPEIDRCVFTTSIVGAARDLVSIVDQHAPMPRPPALELRTSGLWVDPIIQTPWRHVTLGLEAFGVAMEDPAEALGRAWGNRTAVGLDLEWESEADTVVHRELSSGRGSYALPCTVHGQVLLADEEIDLDAVGWRGHSWGVPDGGRWALHGFTNGAAWMAGGATDQAWATSAISLTGTRRDHHGDAAAELACITREPGLVVGATLVSDAGAIVLEPLGWAPVPDAGHGAAMHIDQVLFRCPSEPGSRPGVVWLTR